MMVLVKHVLSHTDLQAKHVRKNSKYSSLSYMNLEPGLITCVGSLKIEVDIIESKKENSFVSSLRKS